MAEKPVALVTGGSRGIGRGICLALANAGYRVAINYAGNEAAAQETLALFPDQEKGMVVQADIGKSKDRERLVQSVHEKWGRIDVLVNNAGITSQGRKDLLDATEESWDQVMAVNLKGPYFLTQKVAKAMVERPSKLHNPTIINISSLSAYALSMQRGDYCISKAGLGMLTQLFAVRLAEHGIRVFEIRPGIIATDMTAANKEKYDKLIPEGFTPIRRWGQPEDIGKAVVMLVGDQLPFSTGDVLNLDGGFHLRQFPA